MACWVAGQTFRGEMMPSHGRIFTAHTFNGAQLCSDAVLAAPPTRENAAEIPAPDLLDLVVREPCPG